MYIIGLNGPPRSGKDTAAEFLKSDLEARTKLPIHLIWHSTPMRLMAFAALGIPYERETYERIKDIPQPHFKGMTLRGFMIALGERFMKFEFGQKIWAELLLKDFDPHAEGILIIPDYGFQIESNYAQLRYHPDNVLMCQLHRPGFDYSNDSRTYVAAEHNRALTNDGELSELYVQTVGVVLSTIRDLNWKI